MNSTEILLVVEDNEDDVYFMNRALKAASFATVRFVEDGKSALDYLTGEGAFADRLKYPFPSIVFLDLKLPFVHGLEVLATIRTRPDLKDLRVYVLTSSDEERDRSQAEQLGIEGYLVKPPTRDMLASIFGAAPGVAASA